MDGRSPATPSTPYGSSAYSKAYHTDINRKKTRKWVEAKVQNYDGDDWGTDYDDEDEPDDSDEHKPAPEPQPDPHPKHRVTAGMRAIGQDLNASSNPSTPHSAGSSPGMRPKDFVPPSVQPPAVGGPTPTYPSAGGGGGGGAPEGPRDVRGLPSLQIQTPNPLAPASRPGPSDHNHNSPGTSAVGGAAAERRSSDHVVSPQSGQRTVATSSSVYSSDKPGYYQPFSPGGDRRNSPAPQSTGAGAGAGVVPSRFPPRKSSISQHDADFTDHSRRSRSSSRPGSAVHDQPAAEGPLASPGGAKPLQPTAAGGKPLPFVRPADIYKRMGEEKEKERRSLESSGRPSLDSITGRGPGSAGGAGGDAAVRRDSGSGAPLKAPPEPLGSVVGTTQRQRSSFGRDDGPDVSRGSQPLTTVAERKSEYGFDRLMGNLGADQPKQQQQQPKIEPEAGDEPETEPFVGKTAAQHGREEEEYVPAPWGQPSGNTRPADFVIRERYIPLGTRSDSMLSPQAVPDPVKRFSSSPKLPDLGRMSGFGADFFNAGSFMSDDNSPALPAFTTADDKPATTTATTTTNPTITTMASTTSASPSVPEPGSAGSQLLPDPPQHQRFFIDSEPVSSPVTRQKSPFSATSAPTTANPAVDSPASLHRGVGSGATTPQPRQPSDTPVSQKATLPSQSVPVRPSLPGGWVTETASTPGEVTPPLNVLPKPAGGLVHQTGEVSPVSEREDDPDHHLRPPALRMHSSGGDGVSDAESETHSEKSGRNSPHSLPPLRTTPSPARGSWRSGSDQGQHATPSPRNGGGSSSIQQTPDSTSSVKPPAPLQPRKGSTPSAEDAPQPPIMRVETISTLENSSPLKESDVLRDEIMRTLSPVRSSNESPGMIGGTSASRSNDDPFSRESAYLDDVYGDYWGGGGGEKKTEPDPVGERKDERPDRYSTPTQEETGPVGRTATPTLQPSLEVAPSKPEQAPLASPEPEPSPPVKLRKRFSWEIDPEEANASGSGAPSPGKKQPTPTTLTGAPAQPEPALRRPSPALSSEGARASPAVASTDGAPRLDLGAGFGTTPFNLSQASPVVPPRRESMEPPSPVSNGPAEEAAHSASSASRPHSQAEDKVLLQAPAQPGSPPPRDGDGDDGHQALETPPMLPPRNGTPRPRSESKMNIMPFQQIMQLPTSDERVDKYVETRAQFAAMDSGLGDWLGLMAGRPEHAAATSNFGYPLGAGGGGGEEPPASPQQPYYQQYLGASSSSINASAAHGGRPTSNVPSGVPHGRSEFKHSSGQVGAKGKGMLLAAGKAGRGLLNKGKNKLREKTGGDKVKF